MAKTAEGVEFYLLEVYGEKRSTPIEEVEKVLKAAVRGTDAVFIESGRLYIAFAGDVRGAVKATRRLMNITKKQGVVTRYRLVVEPFPEDLGNIANKIIEGKVKVKRRPPRKKEPEVEFID